MTGTTYNQPTCTFNCNCDTCNGVTPNSDQSLFGTGTTQGVSYSALTANYYPKSYIDNLSLSGGTGGTVNLTDYLTNSGASATYQIKGIYLTGITSSAVTTALGYTPGNGSFSGLTGKPITLSGYGITDAAIQTADYVITTDGTNIKAAPRNGSGYVTYTGTSLSTVLTNVMSNLTNGGLIHIGKGNYTGIDIISIPYDNIIIHGEGPYTTKLKLKASGDTFYNPLAREFRGMFQVHGVSGFQIHDIGLDGNGQNQIWINNGSQADGPGCLSAVFIGSAYVNGGGLAYNNIINNVYAHDFTQYGFYTETSARNTKILNSSSINNYWNGATIIGEDDLVQNLYTQGSGDVGISIYGQRASLINCYIGPQNGAYSSVASRWGIGVEVYSVITKGHRIIDCVIDGGTSLNLIRGLGLQNTQDVIVDNLKVRNTNNYGILTEGASNVTIMNSSIVSSYVSGFTQGIVTNVLGATNSADIKILNNVVDFTGGFAINIVAGTDKAVVMNNVLKSGSGDLNDGATNTSKSNNYSIGNSAYITESRRASVTPLTGYVSGAGTITTGDTMLTAINKLNGNDGLKANLASPTFTGTLTTPIIAIGLAGKIGVTEGTGGRVGQTVLVAGTKAITISGLTTSSRAFVQLVTPGNTSLSVTYQAVCTTNTLTVQANIAAGTINTADTSTINYFIIN